MKASTYEQMSLFGDINNGGINISIGEALRHAHPHRTDHPPNAKGTHTHTLIHTQFVLSLFLVVIYIRFSFIENGTIKM